MQKLFIKNQSKCLAFIFLFSALIVACTNEKTNEIENVSSVRINKNALRPLVDTFLLENSKLNESNFGYIFLDNYCDTMTSFFIGTDFNRRLLYTPDNYLVDTIKSKNQMIFAFYYNGFNFLQTDTLLTNSMRKKLEFDPNSRHKDSLAWKIKLRKNGEITNINKMYSSVYHIRYLTTEDKEKLHLP